MADIINTPLHINLKRVKKLGNDRTVDIIYPKNSTDDVELSSIENSNIPVGVDNMTGIINNLGSLAFSDKIPEVTNATSSNIGNRIVKRDANGNFSANVITADLSGKATQADQDANGQDIKNTYIKDIKVNGKVITITKGDGTTSTETTQDTTYNEATTSKSGLLSSSDKGKLDNIEAGANKTIVDTELNSTSTNPVQNKAIFTELGNKSNTGHKHVKVDITDFPTSMPASDVYSWAKAKTKPTYNKTEVGLGNVDNTADIDKPISTAVQTALTNLDTALKNYADTKVSNLIGGAVPETLDTITEIATAINNNKSVIDTLNKSITSKVSKEDGKGLSTNDFTDAYKTNVDANTTARHTHSNKSVIDKITNTNLTNWNAASTHVSDSTKHITSNERTLWNTVSNKEPKIATKNTAFNKNFGTTAGTVCQGNDSRLSDARVAKGGNADTVGGKNPNIIAYLMNGSSTVEEVATVNADTVGGYAPSSLIKTGDVINSLTSTVTNKPLSAAQGKALKELIDAKSIPTKLSAFDNDTNYLNSSHNTSSTAHNDIRSLLNNLSSKVNLFLDSTDTAFDQLSDIIPYIKLNREKANSALDALNGLDNKYIASSKLSNGYTEGDSTKVATNKAVTDAYNALNNRIPTSVAALSDGANYAKKNASQTFSGTQTFATAKASASTAYTTAKFRNIVLSTAEPTTRDGSNGDVWIVYNA